MTGQLQLKSNRAANTRVLSTNDHLDSYATPSTTVVGGGFYSTDSRKRTSTYICEQQKTNGNTEGILGITKLYNNLNMVDNCIYLGVTPDEQKTVSVDAPEAWRTALDVPSTADLNLRNNGKVNTTTLSNTDANTLYQTAHCGTYWVDNTCTNIPVSWGILEVLGSPVPMQRYTVNSTNSGAGTTIYMRERLNGTWGAWQVTGSGATSCTITKHSDLPSTAPTVLMGRRGQVCIIHFAHLFKAGTYYNLYNVTPAPALEEHAVVHIGGMGANTIIVTTGGVVRFNNSTTISSDAYIIGQLVYFC